MAAPSWPPASRPPICAYVLGQSDLLRVGLLLAVLPLVCATVLYRTRYRVAGSRRLSPARVPAGSEARVHLRMDNVSRLPTGLLMLQDRVPYVLGPRPRFVLDRVEPGGRREVSYRVRSDLRGRYPLGPLQLRLTDPFGMCELTRSFSTYDTLTVIPRVEPLPPVRLSGEAKGYGDGRQRSLALAGEDDVIPRGYRYGDDLRRVHWRSTARYGELMVRREEQPQRARCTVLLDTRGLAFQGAGPDSAFEWAVSGTASVAGAHARTGLLRTAVDRHRQLGARRGRRRVRGREPGVGGRGRADDGHPRGDRPLGRHGPVPGVRRAARRERGAAGGLPRRPRRGAGRGGRPRCGSAAGARSPSCWTATTWVREPSDVPGPLDRSEERLRMLREAGWTALSVPRGASLDELWRQADRRAHGRRARPGAGG